MVLTGLKLKLVKNLKKLNMIKLGIIGFSKGNGHPYSFSAIINGYNEKYFKKVSYPQILEYLKEKKKKDFFIKDLKITHAWSQNFKKTKLLCLACNIKTPLKNINEMASKVDGVIIARDDWRSHKKIASIFLKKRIPVFIDKPLTLSDKELLYFKKFADQKLLMSCSALRFSNELKEAEFKIKKKNLVKMIIANVANDVEKYGVHMLEVISALGLLKINKIIKLKSFYKSFHLNLKSNKSLILNCFGPLIHIFNIQLYLEKEKIEVNFKDNFTSFKNTLIEFKNFIKYKKSSFSFQETRKIMKTLIKLKNIK